MTLYNCTVCKGVHDSAEPSCTSTIVHPIGIGNMHPDLVALVEFKDAVIAWMEAEGELIRNTLISNATEEDLAEFRRLKGIMPSLWSRVLKLARRWSPLENMDG